MTTIKIISNPYMRTIDFSVFIEATGEWEVINLQNNPNSKLLKKEIRFNFFPYKIKEIIEILQEEYSNDLCIVFEGTNDEYDELAEVCNLLDNVEVHRSDRGIENARDILPEIVDIFTQVQPIVDKSINSEDARGQINKDIAKFIDASNDIVPICVLGNYSSGKSMFINALIGREILPSGDRPITAKIYKVKQSNDANLATISLLYDDKPVKVSVTDKDYVIDCDDNNDFILLLESALEEQNARTLEEKVSACLEITNKQKGVSVLIDIEMPFADGPLKRTKNSFVIFDTPGSNTATYEEHFKILEEQMKDLSNGMPIYVAKYDALDTCDNKNLYNEVTSISQIDSRFTMIVINKADTANIKEKTLTPELKNDVLEQALPRLLNSDGNFGGIYFISSIMGLGSKNDGVFTDDFTEGVFEKNKSEYLDDKSKWYKELYKYNILPEQIKQSTVCESEKAGNKIFANSGLLAIEHEIVNFAEKYSAYDKCNQSNKYLERIIGITQEELQEAKEFRSQRKQELEELLEEDKKELIGTMEMRSSQSSIAYNNMYDDGMKDAYDKECSSYTQAKMKSIEKELLKQNQEEHNYSERVDDVKDAFSAFLADFSDIGKKNVGSVIKNMGDDLKETWENAIDLRNSKIASDKDTARELLRIISKSYNTRLDEATTNLCNESRRYWDDKSEQIKNELLQIVANSTTLDSDKKAELSNIILTYGTVKFNDKHVFKRDPFEKKVWVFWRVIYLNKINTHKLAQTYNRDYSKDIKEFYDQLKVSHSNSFDDWLSALVDTLRINIVDYSPKLSAQAKQIAEETRVIEELEETKDTLTNYSKDIVSLMDWEELA